LLSHTHLSLDLASVGELLPPSLPAFLLRQRWFGARSAPLRSVSVVDVLPVADPDRQAAHVLVGVELADGASAIYQLVLGVADLSPVDPSSAIAHVELAQGTVCLYDILRCPTDCEWLMRALKRHAGIASQDARLAVEWMPALDALATPWKARPLDAEQTNSSIVLGHGAILKFFRRLERGINPDVEITRALTLAGFGPVPRHLGSVSCECPDDPPFTLAAMQQYVSHEGDGWSDAQSRLRAFLDDPSEPRLSADAQGARALGVTIASMHAALAGIQGAAWEPEPIQARDLLQWRDTMLRRLERAAVPLRQLPGSSLLIASLVGTLPDLPQPGARIRIHGDLHLGQVLQTADGWVVFDFEGEPGRPMAERTAKDSPIRDVAGMLRSYDYAAFAVLFALAAPGSRDWERFEPLALRWEGAMREAFFDGWRHAAPRSMMPGPESLSVLVELCELDKADYELAYEMDHRPDWLRIPMVGIHRIISRKRV
jgi:trehalose synthase-fused probable maltokinase